MDDIESLCRIICKAQGLNPDTFTIGNGYISPQGVEYPVWRTRYMVATAILEAGWKPPKKRKVKNVTN